MNTAPPVQTTPPPTSADVQTAPSQVNTTIPQQPAQAAPPAPGINPNVVHDTLFGRAAKFLMGNTTSYSIDPQTGKTIATQTPQKPGSLFRSILAGALLGGASAQEAHSQNPNMGGTGGAMIGGAAGIKNNVQMDLLKRQQAQQQFKNQQDAEDMQMKQDDAKSLDTLRKAQIAQANAETLRTNALTQSTNLAMHRDIAANGKQSVADYDAAGLQPIFKDIPESEMQQTIKNRPGASAFDWEPTGVKTTLDDKGNPQFEYTYSAYDPKGKISVSQGTIDLWKKDGMDKYYPELFNVVKAGKQVDAQQYIELKRTDQQLFNDTLTRQKADQQSQEAISRIHLQNAQAARAVAATMKDRQEISDAAIGKKASEQFGNALQELNDVGGDFSKLKPSSRVIIGESASKLMPSITQEIRELQASNDPAQQPKIDELFDQLDQLRNLSASAMLSTHTSPVPTSGGVPAGATTATNPKTGQKMYSTDGGKSWNPVPTTAAPKMVTVHGAGATQEVPDNELAGFLAKNPEFKVVPAASVMPTPAAQPNNYSGR